MNFGPLILIGTGVVIVVVAAMNSRHSRSSNKHIAVHKNMSDERIEAQFSKGAPRSDANMGMWFGAFVIFAGLVWLIMVPWMLSTL